MTVRFTSRGRDDLRAILTHLNQLSPHGARNVGRALRKTIGLIDQFPDSGRFAGEQNARVLPVGRYPYLIYWANEGGEAWIVHIRHAARQKWNPTEE